ncbi:MAG: gephyrin-like molybdotransferase Glp [Hyphomicrobiales bacterium]
MSRPELNDCFLHDKDRLKHSEALAILKKQVQPLGKTEDIPLTQALGRIIAEEVTAPLNVPLSDNAAVDGYVFAHSAYETSGGWFPIVTRIAAGDTNPVALPSEGAGRIFTGASMPAGADTVAMQEDCETHEQNGTKFVAIPPGLKQGANCRRAGEDVKQGAVLFSSGHLLTPQDIAGLASLGRASVSVFKTVKVAIISTGDELIMPGNDIKPGQVYNSNGPLLESLLAPLPVSVNNVGILPDNLETIQAKLNELAQTHDVILTTGGASRGEEDHVLTALDAVGRRHMWQLAIKPGRPMTFGHIGETAFIGLPGNPVAAFVCFLLYSRQIILALGGAEWQEPVRYPLPAAFSINKKKPDRREFLRGILRHDGGQLRVDKFKRDGSGLISGLREADGLIEINEETTSLEEGDSVSFIPFSAFGI